MLRELETTVSRSVAQTHSNLWQFEFFKCVTLSHI